jgi:hypothetical protein
MECEVLEGLEVSRPEKGEKERHKGVEGKHTEEEV